MAAVCCACDRVARNVMMETTENSERETELVILDSKDNRLD